jgi:ABC-type Fe3+/spermidine/putrescine transport system ATPase subunit
MNGVGVRPEATRISRQPLEAGARCVPATVAHTVFLGGTVQIHARLTSGEIAVATVARQDDSFQTGEAVFVSWRPAEEIFFPDDHP